MDKEEEEEIDWEAERAGYSRMAQAEDEGLCFGEYGRHQGCPTCKFKTQCQRFTEAEKELSLRHKGKYTGRGKESRRDRY